MLNNHSEILKSIAASLSCPAYWENNYQNWTVEINPTITRRTATVLLKEDLEKLNVAFVSNKDITRKIASVLSELKKSTDIIAEFWVSHSTTLKQLALKDSVDENVIEQVLKRKAANSIVESSSSSTVTTSPDTMTKRLRSKSTKQKEKESVQMIN